MLLSKKKAPSGAEVLAIFPIEEFYQAHSESTGHKKPARKVFKDGNGHLFVIPRMARKKYKILNRDRKCQCCGITAKYFSIEKDFASQRQKGKSKSRDLHINFYGEKDDGHLEMLTIDHIVPKCIGGTDCANNLHILCSTCNSVKGGTITPLSHLRALMIVRQKLLQMDSPLGSKKMHRLLEGVKKLLIGIGPVTA